MSRRTTNFTLIFGLLKIPIGLYNSIDSPVSFKQAVKGRSLRYIKVLSKNDEGVTSMDDIERIPRSAEIEQHYDNDGELFPIDAKKIKAAMNITTDAMGVISVIPNTFEIARHFDGKHYFVDIQKTGKGKNKKVSKQDQVIYTTLHHYLLTDHQSLLVSFNSRGNQKYGLIYADENGLIMSGLYPSNLHRLNDGFFLIATDISRYVKGLSNILNAFKAGSLKPNQIRDDSAIEIEKIVLKMIAGEEVELPEAIEEEDDMSDMLAMLENS